MKNCILCLILGFLFTGTVTSYAKDHELLVQVDNVFINMKGKVVGVEIDKKFWQNTPKHLETVWHKINYDTSGKIQSVENTKIDYDFSGKIKTVGNTKIDYDLSDKVRSIGNVKIDYDLSGKIRSVGNTKIDYDLSGKVRYVGDTRIDDDFWGRIKSVGKIVILPDLGIAFRVK